MAYEYLDGYREVGKCHVKKMTLGELLEFGVRYRAYIANKISGANCEKSASELCKFATGEDVNKEHVDEVLAAALEYNFLKNKNKKDGEDKDGNPDWVYQVLTIFALNFGWTREQCLRLYPEEIALYLGELHFAISHKVGLEKEAEFYHGGESQFDYLKKHDGMKFAKAKQAYNKICEKYERKTATKHSDETLKKLTEWMEG